MMRLGVAVALPLLLLAGCSAAPPSEDGPDLSTYPPSTTEPYDPCLAISAGAFAALQQGLDQKQPGFTLTDAKAIAKNGTSGPYWLVAGKFDAAGIPGTVGVWGTVNDPTVEGDNAYVSVDAIAREFSWYLQPQGVDASFPGVDDVKDCL